MKRWVVLDPPVILVDGEFEHSNWPTSDVRRFRYKNVARQSEGFDFYFQTGFKELKENESAVPWIFTFGSELEAFEFAAQRLEEWTAGLREIAVKKHCAQQKRDLHAENEKEQLEKEKEELEKQANEYDEYVETIEKMDADAIFDLALAPASDDPLSTQEIHKTLKKYEDENGEK